MYTVFLVHLLHLRDVSQTFTRIVEIQGQPLCSSQVFANLTKEADHACGITVLIFQFLERRVN